MRAVCPADSLGTVEKQLLHLHLSFSPILQVGIRLHSPLCALIPTYNLEEKAFVNMQVILLQFLNLNI